MKPTTPMSRIHYFSLFFLTLWLTPLAAPAQARCDGCLCPGDPCQLCPLPAMKSEPLQADAHEICVKIQQKIPPTDAQPGSNEYFPNLDRSIAACVQEGGDVIRNRRRNAEFPSRFYCKPPTPIQPR